MSWPGACAAAIAAPFRVLLTAEGRRAWALMLLAGGGLSMTAFAGCALWLVRGEPERAFWLGVLALALIAIVLTGYAGLLMKRTIRAEIGGNSLEISDQVQGGDACAD